MKKRPSEAGGRELTPFTSGALVPERLQGPRIPLDLGVPHARDPSHLAVLAGRFACLPLAAVLVRALQGLPLPPGVPATTLALALLGIGLMLLGPRLSLSWVLHQEEVGDRWVPLGVELQLAMGPWRLPLRHVPLTQLDALSWHSRRMRRHLVPDAAPSSREQVELHQLRLHTHTGQTLDLGAGLLQESEARSWLEDLERQLGLPVLAPGSDGNPDTGHREALAAPMLRKSNWSRLPRLEDTVRIPLAPGPWNPLPGGSLLGLALASLAWGLLSPRSPSPRDTGVVAVFLGLVGLGLLLRLRRGQELVLDPERKQIVLWQEGSLSGRTCTRARFQDVVVRLDPGARLWIGFPGGKQVEVDPEVVGETRERWELQARHLRQALGQAPGELPAETGAAEEAS